MSTTPTGGPTSSAPLPPDILRRLVYAKYLLWKAAETIDSKSPLAHALGVLPLQDAAEMFLRTIADGLRIPLKDTMAFNQIIDSINASPAGKGHPVPYATELNRLNRLRVDFKHHGIEPKETEVAASRRHAERFAGEALPAYLNVSLDSVSLADLISQRRVQNRVKTAETHFTNGDYMGTATVCAEALAILLSSFSKSGLLHPPKPQMPGPHLRSRIGQQRVPSLSSGESRSSSERTRDNKLESALERLGTSVGALGSTLESTREVLRYQHQMLEQHDHLLTVMLHGLDVSEYLRFLSTTPHAPGMPPVAHRQAPRSDDAQFCIRFVIDAALRLDASPLRRTLSSPW